MDAENAASWSDIVVGIAVLLGCWAALVGVGLRALPELARTWRGEEGRYRTALLAVLLLALALRFGVAPPTPEIRNRLTWAYAPELGLHAAGIARKYGLGLPLFAKALAVVFGPSEAVVLAAHGVLGAASVLPAAGFLRSVSGSRSVGLCAAFALAVLPLHVRFSRVDSPFTLDTLATLLLFFAVARHAVTPRKTWLVVAVASAITAASMRIEGILGPAFAVLLAAMLWPRARWVERSTWAAVAATVVLLVPHAAMVWSQVVFETGYRYDTPRAPLVLDGLPCWAVLNPTMQSWALIALTPLGFLDRRVPLPVVLWAAVGVAVNSSVEPTICPTETSFSIARYQLQAVPFAAMLAGTGLAWLSSQRWLRPLAVVAVLAATAEVWRLARAPTVLTREHAFLRAHLPDVPSPCRIHVAGFNTDTTLFPPAYLSRLAGRDHQWRNLEGFVLDDGPTGRAGAADCDVYYAAAQCSTVYAGGADPMEHRTEACVAFETAYGLVPIAETTLDPDPVSPMGAAARTLEPIPIGLYRMVDPPLP